MGHSYRYGTKNIVVRTFNLDTTINPSSLLARAKKAAYETAGATLLGDERSGRFSHSMVRGEYRMVEQTVIVALTEKHWLLPWPFVEAQQRNSFSSPVPQSHREEPTRVAGTIT